MVGGDILDSLVRCALVSSADLVRFISASNINLKNVQIRNSLNLSTYLKLDFCVCSGLVEGMSAIRLCLRFSSSVCPSSLLPERL